MSLARDIRFLRLVPLALLALSALTFAQACDEDGAPSPSPATSVTPADVALEGEVTVFAASSLTEAFTAAGEAFHAANPGATAKFNFAASSALAVQINEGAPADVFASADNAQMKAVVDAGNAVSPQVFVRNTPVVVVPADSAIDDFEDLATDGIRLVLAGPDVPIGRYARQVIENASGSGGIAPDFATRVLANVRSDEANVRAVLSKVQLGEADAGIVYQTDATVAGSEVRVIEIPAEFNVIAEYPLAAVATGDTLLAAAFIEFVLSEDGQAILREYGFASP